MKDMIPGGKGDKAKPSDFDPEQLKMGIEVELEHAKNNRRLAREIAMDHLSEDPRYYTKLKKVHKEHAYMRSGMHSFEELLEMMSSVNAWLTEGATPPPPPAAAFRTVPKKDPAPVLKGRTGATPPSVPTKQKPVPEPSDDTKTALGGIGVKKYKPKRPDLMHKFDTTTTESLLHALMQIRDVLGEARMPTNSIKMRKPRPMILRPKPLVRPGSKLKPGTSAGPGF